MEKILAFIDESGDPKFNEGASDRIEFSSILIEESKESQIVEELEKIRSELNLTEFKSSRIRTEKRRIEILESLDLVDFKFINLSIEKRKVFGKWKENPKVFYKYTQKILHTELHRLYENRSVTIDKFGNEQYQQSLKEYLESNLQLNLFGDVINIGSAKNNILIQIADLYAGTNRLLTKGKFVNSKEIGKLLSKKELHILVWPDDFQRFILKNIKNEQDKKIADISTTYAERYIENNRANPDFKHRIMILEYLLFQVKYVNANIYTYSNELIDWLKENKINYSDEEFRKEIMGALRDDGVVIASSRKGLKIPMSEQELNEYLNYTSGRYLTIMRRLKETYNTLNASALGKLKIFESSEFDIHKEFFKLLDK